MQIDPCEGDLSDERMLDHTYSGVEEDTFQVSMIALHGSACSTDLDYLQSSTPKVGTCFGFGGSFFDVYATFFYRNTREDFFQMGHAFKLDIQTLTPPPVNS